MSWTLDGVPGHEGDLLGLAPVLGEPTRYGDPYRELHPAFDGPSSLWYGRYLQVVQLGCTCGWRSPRIEAPTSACWQGRVEALAWFQDQCRKQWEAHAIATHFGDQEAARVRAGG